jgi:creatinine amidohydrolase
MLAKAAELVRPDQVATADDEDRTKGLVFAHPVNHTSTNGVTGYPSRATVKQGDLLFQWLVEDLSAMVRQGMVEEPPLPSSRRESRP